MPPRHEGAQLATLTVPILGANLAPTAAKPDANKRMSIIELQGHWLNDLVDVDAPIEDINIIRKARSGLQIRDADVVVVGSGEQCSIYLIEETEDHIARFFEALSIHAPGTTTWVEFAIEPAAWLADYGLAEETWVALRRDYASRLDSVARRGEYDQYDLDEASSAAVLLYQELLNNCHKSARIAAKRLVRALERPDDDDRIIDLCIGLEALLGSGFSEVVHRLSLRASALLGHRWGLSSFEIYKAMRDLYSIRSKIVHGDSKPYEEPMIKVGNERMHASRFAVGALSSLLKLLVADRSFAPEKVDEAYIFTAFDAVE